MKTSYLVQQLVRPSSGLDPDAAARLEQVFAFGASGGGGLSQDAFRYLGRCFSFAMMGRAQYEDGIVAEALFGLATDVEQLVAVALHEVAIRSQDDPNEADGPYSVYVLCRASDLVEVRECIRRWAIGDDRELLDSPELSFELRHPGHHVGGLECDNGWFYFTDEAVWRNTAALFGITVPPPERS